MSSVIKITWSLQILSQNQIDYAESGLGTNIVDQAQTNLLLEMLVQRCNCCVCKILVDHNTQLLLRAGLTNHHS